MKWVRFGVAVLVLALFCASIPLYATVGKTPGSETATSMQVRDAGICSPTKAPKTPGLSPDLASLGDKTWDASKVRIPPKVRSKIDPRVLKQLLETERDAQRLGKDEPAPTTYLVYLHDQAPTDDLVLVSDVRARRRTLVSRLQETAERSQVGVVSYLKQQLDREKVARYKTYWVFNGLVVEGDLETALALAARPEVESIRPNRIHRLAPPQIIQPSTDSEEGQAEWNIIRIGADRVWESYNITGEGVVVANMDSGVDWTHPALQHSYRGYNAGDPAASTHDHNWYDPTESYPDAPGPNEAHLTAYSDHGTHTMGSLVGGEVDGSNAIGVAPGASWIALKVFNDEGEATDEWIHDGFQWCLAPTDLEGHNADPNMAPDIVSNSWGDDNPLDDTFHRDLDAWRAAGIFSTWAAGNAGPDSGTIGSPASYGDALAVGAINTQDRVASFSSRGPSPWGDIKPNIVAPGVNIRSSIPGGGYEGNWNGTSMATPQVAGLVALMWQAADHALTITSTKHVITNTALDLGTPGADNDTGYGLIDAYQAVGAIFCGGSFAGRVTEAQTGLPIGGAKITMCNLATQGQVHVLTRVDGSYALTVAEGLYDVTAEKFGYLTETARSIEIRAQMLTQLDFDLLRLPSGTIQGRVTRSADGEPVAATVTLVSTPLQVVTDEDGYYTFDAPASDYAGPYTVRALSGEPGYRGTEVTGIVVTSDGVTTVDLELSSIPRLLLVDADAWTTTGHLPFYQTALDGLMYSYDVRTISDPPDDNPGAAKLAQYDIVIWSQPIGSPGYIVAWRDLATYLNGGGRLLISGQDIGYWDSGYGHAPTRYTRYLHARYVSDDGGLGSLSGTAGGALDGLYLEYNTDDSAQNQSAPDVIAVADALSRPIIGTSSGAVMGLSSDACTHRTIYFSFGLEGVGPAVVRQQVLSRAIDALMEDRVTEGPRLSIPSPAHSAVLGSTVRYGLSVVNEGKVTDRYEMSCDCPSWTANLIDSTTQQVVTRTGSLGPCEAAELWLDISVPALAAPNQTEICTIRATSLVSPTSQATDTVRTVALRPWDDAEGLGTVRYRLGCVASESPDDCKIYAIGGYVPSEGGETSVATDLVEILDLTTGTWETGTSKPTPAANSAIAHLDGLIYVIGGYDPQYSDAADRYSAVVEIYNPATDNWIGGRPLPQPLAGMAAAALDGKVYAFGGSGPQDGSKASYVYDPATDTWSQVAPLPGSDLVFAQAVSLNGFIYLAGGWPNRNQLFRYDPATDSWATLAAMHKGRHSFAMVAVCDVGASPGHIYMAGGADEWSGLDSAERYDPETDSWLDLPSLDSGQRFGSAGAYIDGKFYVVGGADQSAAHPVEFLDINSPLSGSYFAVDDSTSKPGDTLNYTLVLRNPASGEKPANWSHILPDELIYVEGSLTGGAEYDLDTRRLHWSGRMPESSTSAFDFQTTVQVPQPVEPGQGTIITSTARLDGGGCAPIELVAKTTASVPSLRASTKLVDKSQVAPGNLLHYIINVSNDSPHMIDDAALIDPIPEHTSYVPGSVSGATYNAGLDRIEWSGTLPPADQSDGTFNWIDATGGQALGLSDDSCDGPFNLGFDFEFYGNTYSQIYVNSNGMILFDGCSSRYSNVSIPDSGEPNNFVAPFWDDLRPGWGEGEVYLATFGTPPYRYAVIEWYAVNIYGQEQTQTFEVLLYESSNSILCQYLELSGERGKGDSATVGIENRGGTEGVQYLYDGSPQHHQLHDGLAIELEHSSTCKASTHLVSYDVRVDALLPPAEAGALMIITNTAQIDDGLSLHERTVTSTVDSPVFATSDKTVSTARALAGDTLIYTLRIVNTGRLDATDASMVDPLPQGLTYVPGSLVGEGAIYNEVWKRIEWQGAVSVGAPAVDISYRVVLAEGLPINTWISNTATIYERSVLMAEPTAEVWVNPVDLSTSSKIAHTDELPAGSPVTYTITLRNSGLTSADHVVMTDALPAELELVTETLTGGTWDHENRTVFWQGALPPKAEQEISFQAQVLPSLVKGGWVTNTALLDDGHGVVIERAAVVKVLRGDLSTSDMSAGSSFTVPGGWVIYTFRLINTGEIGIGATLSCTPAARLIVAPDTLYATAGDVSLAGQTLTWRGSIVPHGMVIVRFSATVSKDAPLQTITSEALLVDDAGAETTLRAAVTVIEGEYTFFPLICER